MKAADVTKLAELAEPLRSRLTAFLADDRFSIVSGRRSFEEQVALRRAHCGTSWDDIYTKPSSECSPPTARPGHSQHEVGLAADLSGPLTSAAAALRRAGLDRPVTGENWHVEPSDAAALAGGGIDPGDVVGGAVGVFVPGAGGALGELDVGDAIANALGGVVEPIVKGFGRIALISVLVLGGVGLVVLGGMRSAGGAPGALSPLGGKQ